MRIGELAKSVGVSVDTVRYYERLGLIEATHRSAGGFREFDDEARARLAEIKGFQALGLTLEEIHVLVSDGHYSCGDAASALAAVSARIDGAVAALRAAKARADAAASRCRSGECGHGPDNPMRCA